MEEESKAVVVLVILVFVGILLVNFVTMAGVFVVLIGGVVFFVAMVVAGENSDFNAIHNEW